MARKKHSFNAILTFSRKRRLNYVKQPSERSVLVKMEKEEFRAVTKLFYLHKWTAAQIKAEFKKVHGDTAPALKIIISLVHKVMATDFWDAQGIIIIDYFQKATLLSRLYEKLRTERPKFVHKKSFFIQITHLLTRSQFQWQKYMN